MLNSVLTTYAQADYVVELKHYGATRDTKYIDKTVLKSFLLENQSLVKGLPDLCKSYAVHYCYINYDQAMYDWHRLNEITSENYNWYKNTFVVDTTKFSNEIKSLNNKVFIYVGLDTAKNEKYVIVDSNGDRDFSNDSLYVFSLDHYSNINRFRYSDDDMCPIINLKINYYDGNKYVPAVSNVRLNPFRAYENDIKKYPSKEDFYLQVLLLSNDYFSGSVKVNNIDLTVHSSHGTPSVYNSNLGKNSRYMIFDSTYKGYPIDYAIDNTLVAAKRKLHIVGREGNKLFINDLGSFTDSCLVGDFIPQLVGNSTVEDKQICLNPLFKDKYVFIDFWGSWCAPCIGSLPKIMELYEQVKNRSDVVICGIALEQPKDIQKLNNIIADRKIEWLNIWSESKNLKKLDSPHGKLKINSFPSYVIIDKSGKILFTTNDKTCSRDLAIDYFKELIAK